MSHISLNTIHLPTQYLLRIDIGLKTQPVMLQTNRRSIHIVIPQQTSNPKISIASRPDAPANNSDDDIETLATKACALASSPFSDYAGAIILRKLRLVGKVAIHLLAILLFGIILAERPMLSANSSLTHMEPSAPSIKCNKTAICAIVIN